MMVDDDAPHAEALKETGFWGRRGAGCLVYARSTGRFLIGQRSGLVEQPGAWGTWGGAVPEGVSAADSTLRELAEETDYSGHAELVSIHIFRHPSGFSYENFLAVVDDEFEPLLNWEHEGYLWVEHGDWPDPLHFGMVELLASVPDLRLAVTIEPASPKRP